MAKDAAREIESLIRQSVEALGLRLWNVELVKESGGLTLLVSIDRDEGVTIADCSAATRVIDPILDAADPIPTSYCLEVSSVGFERTLKREEHFDYALKRTLTCTVRLFAPLEGEKELRGTLTGFDGETLSLDINGRKLTLPRKSAAKIYTEDERTEI